MAGTPPDPEGWASARMLVVVAHPDDEVLGCGALLARLQNVAVVHVTDGAPRDGADARAHGFPDPAAYAVARRGEAEAALALAGVPADRLAGLGVADQEVPGAMATVARALRRPMARADLVLTHAFEGGHGDHDAVAFAVHAARDLLPEGERPALVEMPFYHAGPDGWVRGRFAPAEAGSGESPAEAVVHLTPAEQALKARMVAAHASQGATLGDFALDAERFRFAPPRDFARRPHGGPLLYERHGWNLTWTGWLAHLAAARAALADPVVESGQA